MNATDPRTPGQSMFVEVAQGAMLGVMYWCGGRFHANAGAGVVVFATYVILAIPRYVLRRRAAR
jgi:hypothetical protein